MNEHAKRVQAAMAAGWRILDDQEEYYVIVLSPDGKRAGMISKLDSEFERLVAECMPPLPALPPLSQVVTWIPVEERLPEKEGLYHCAIKDSIVDSWYNKGEFYSGGTKVTHWAEPLKHPSEL